MDSNQVMERFVAIPFTPTPDRAEIVSKIMRELMRFETIFTDWQKACDEVCGECEKCNYCRAVIAHVLAKPDSWTWEIWRVDGETELAGIVMLTHVLPGVDAEAHYAFFDGDLKGKTEMLNSLIEWGFEDHPDWHALRRLTIAVPDYAFALAKHAQRYLGFGGDFVFNHKGKELKVEGVRRKSMHWRGVDRDMIVLGRVR